MKNNKSKTHCQNSQKTLLVIPMIWSLVQALDFPHLIAIGSHLKSNYQITNQFYSIDFSMSQLECPQISSKQNDFIALLHHQFNAHISP